MGEPFVSIAVHKEASARRLQQCLFSLTSQDYPRDRFELLLADGEASRELLSVSPGGLPSVRVLDSTTTSGRARWNDDATRNAHGDFLAFFSGAYRADPSWLRELVLSVLDTGASAAASRVLDEEAGRALFSGGGLSLFGHAWPFEGEANEVASEPAPLLYPSSGAMLVERAAYEAAGGFDPDYNLPFEDVDLGWRMALLGHRTVLSSASIVHAEPKDRPFTDESSRSCERNALYTIYKCFGDDWLERVLPVAIALTLARGLLHFEVDSQQFALGTRAPAATSVPRATIARMIALGDFTSRLPMLRQKRAFIQSRRIVDDEVLLPLFVEPLRTHGLGPEYERLAEALYAEFSLKTSPSRRAPGNNASAACLPEPFESSPDQPTVSIIIPTVLGPAHLPDCLSSLRGLNYPANRLEIVVVDNNSLDDPTSCVQENYPGAKLLRLGTNRGFCGGIEAGARAARGEWLAFLNDDTRVDPQWIDEMLACARRRSATCVGARILDWKGKRVDFAGGAVSFEGKGFQIGHGSRDLERWNEERPTLFACGAAMLVRKDVFHQTGGFDEAMFAYYEDVNFGWKLWILGHEVWFCPKALVYHKHQGTSGGWDPAGRLRLLERNALRTVFTHPEPKTLSRVLPASLLLASQRILLAAGLALEGTPGLFSTAGRFWQHTLRELAARGAHRSHGIFGSLRRLGVANVLTALRSATQLAIAMGHNDGDEDGEEGHHHRIPASGAAALLGLKEWLETLAGQRRSRAEIQGERRRSDGDILRRFGSHWTHPSSATDPTYRAAHGAVVRCFALDDWDHSSDETV